MENMRSAGICFQPWDQYNEFHVPQFVPNQSMNKEKKNVFTQMHI